MMYRNYELHVKDLVGERSETLARPKDDSLITSPNRHSLSASRVILHLPMCGELALSAKQVAS